ncbi:MAG: S41 family peptidase [Chloroflexota bacterium]|nr:S41 family peptidase [Chloroflexota bacterium]
MENKGIRTCLIIGISIIILAAVFLAGTGVGYFIPRLFGENTALLDNQDCPPCPELVTTESECPECPYLDPSGDAPEEYQELFAPFWETWQIVHEEYVDQPVDDLNLMRGAIEGMLSSLGDKHTSYMTPDEFKQANESLEGEYQGIGAWVDITGNYVEIISPMRNSPADQAGLQPKDKVIAVDGEDMTDIPGDLVLKRILGPAGTDITLTIQRDEEIFDVTITRDNIVVPTVDYEILDDNIAYIGLYNYGENTTDQLQQALRDMRIDKPDGLIFDLRDNGGGYLNTAIQVVSEFIGEGVVMYEEYGDGEMLAYEAIPGGLATEIPMVVLVNGGTASASEITAGAIQDYGRAPLVGVTTYGKGSVQSWIELEDEAGGVRVTIARWLTPEKRQISGEGLEPEYIVEMTEEDYIEGNDPQLDKAIKILKSVNE